MHYNQVISPAFRPSPSLKFWLTDPARPFIHRDLSWTQFNRRVLDQAKDPTNPLLERLKFLSITASNLDEFFMIRMATLRKGISQALRRDDKLNVQRTTRIRNHILEEVSEFVLEQIAVREELSRALAPHEIDLAGALSPSLDWFEEAREFFSQKILPELLNFEPFNPRQIHALENGQIAAIFPSGIWFRVPRKLRAAFAFTSAATGRTRIVFLDQLLTHFLGPAFGLSGQPLVLRLTRDGDVSVDLEEEDPESIPDAIRTSLHARERGRVIRMQVLDFGADVTLAKLLSKCVGVLQFKANKVFSYAGTFCMHGLWSTLVSIPAERASKPELSYPPSTETIPEPLKDLPKIFEQIRTHDLLLHHPYDSFAGLVNWVRAACEDPAVTFVAQTIYRMDALSPIVGFLKQAAKKKRVVAVVELRARFDELNNLALTDELRKAGVEVYFGLPKLKAHAKVALVERQEASGPVLYTHLSTGNYHAGTARQYTDLGLLTADAAIGADAKLFFESLSSGQVPQGFKKLVAAPTRLHRKLLQLIGQETEFAKQGKPARIFAKINALVAEDLIQRLYDASAAGVRVDLVVRGACALVPGLKGISENVRVISVVDRYLEHSRIFSFSASDVVYCSSADWMPRNFFSRLEFAFPIESVALRRYITDTLIPLYLDDNVKARELGSDGIWKPIARKNGSRSIRAQTHLAEIHQCLAANASSS